jgi:DNA-binding transcriptional LysR family regulator
VTPPALANFLAAGEAPIHIGFGSMTGFDKTIQSLVCAEMGLSLIPAMAAKPGQRSVPQYRSFSSPRPTRKIVAAWPKQRPPGHAATEFLKIISARFGKSSR